MDSQRAQDLLYWKAEARSIRDALHRRGYHAPEGEPISVSVLRFIRELERKRGTRCDG